MTTSVAVLDHASLGQAKKYKIDGFVRYACPDCRWRGFTKETYTALKKLSDRLPALPDEIDPRGELSRPERRPE